jgi:hypothetical protein
MIFLAQKIQERSRLSKECSCRTSRALYLEKETLRKMQGLQWITYAAITRSNDILNPYNTQSNSSTSEVSTN